MSIDYSKIKQRLTKLQNKGGGGDSTFWRPKDGETVISGSITVSVMRLRF